MHILKIGACQVHPEAPRAGVAGQPAKTYAKVLYLGGAFTAENPKGLSGEFKAIEVSVAIIDTAREFAGESGKRLFVGKSISFGEIVNAVK